MYENLNVPDSIKQVYSDYSSGNLHKNIAHRYPTILFDLESELHSLGIYDWVNSRIEQKNIDVSIVKDKWYFVEIGELDRGFIATMEYSGNFHHPDIDIILLGPHVQDSFEGRKKTGLHELIHSYIFHNNVFINQDEPDYNLRIDRLEEVHLNEYMAALIPFCFPDLAPAYGGAKLNDEAQEILNKLGTNKGKDLLDLSLNFKTIGEVKNHLNI